jgi:hypothetical protein
MRLPWPFGRAQRSPSAGRDAATRGDSTRSSSGSPAEGGSPPERGYGDAWRSLPPLAETVGPPPLVAPNRSFAAALAANEAPAPILAPLSHGRSLEAPRGLVSGIARPTTRSGAPLPAPVQRSPLASRGAGADLQLDWEVAAPPDATPAPAVAAAAPAAVPEPPAVPLRRLDSMLAAASPAKALTRAPEPARAPLVGLVGQPRAMGLGRTTGAAQATPAVQRAPADSAPPPTPLPPPPKVAPPPAPGPRLTVGQVRRLGLGAPVAGGPVTSATRSFASAAHEMTPAPAPRTIPPTFGSAATAIGIQRAPADDVRDMPVASGPAAGPAQDGAAGGRRGPAMDTSAAALAPAAPPAVARRIGPSVQRAPAGTASPIVSAQPLRAGVQRAPLLLPQRAAEGPGAGSAPPTATSATSGGVKVHRDGRASQLSKDLQARSFTHGGEIFLPESHGPLTSGTGKALLAHELTHVGQQRRLGSGLPAEHTPHGKSLEAEAVAAERSPDMPLALTTPGQGTPDTGNHQRSALSVPPSEAPGPQRAPADDPTATRTQSSGRMSPGSSGTSRSPSGSGHGHSDQELEVLAHQLYHRIGRHLRRELLVDRERVGFALDLP